MITAVQPANAEWLIRLLAYIGGAGSTVLGSWISSKIHVYQENRKTHLDDIKRTVLSPIRDELETFEPFVFNRRALFFVVQTTTKRIESAPLTESTLEAERMLSAAFPTRWLFRGKEPALTQDVRTTHLPEVMGALNKFTENWALYAAEYQYRIRRLAERILELSDLPPFPNRAAAGWPLPVVMHLDLALLIHSRSMELETSALKLEHMSGSDSWIMQGEDGKSYAVGQKEQVEALFGNLNVLLGSENGTGKELLNRAIKIQAEFARVRGLLDFAIASHRLRKKCDLVSFR